MEERKLNEKESLELITRMLQDTKMNLEAGSGNNLIIWGISTFITNTIVYLLLYFTQSPMSFWAWMLCPLIGIMWTKSVTSNSPKITNKIDKMVGSLSLCMIFISVLLPLAFVTLAFLSNQGLIIQDNQLMNLIPFIEMLIISLELIAIAIIIDFKPLRIGGLIGAVLSIALLYNSIDIHTLIFGLWSITSMIIPGIKLNKYIKSKKNA